jgi:outer membrane immunogenic protein
MNRLLATASALAVFALASQASAADLAARSPTPVYSKAPEYVAVSNWNGWYVGGNVGWTGGASSLDARGVAGGDGTPENTAALVQTTNQHVGASSGVIGGAQFGYNFQIAPSVIAGFEADIQSIGAGKRTSSASANMPIRVDDLVPGISTSITGSSQPSYLGTLRARLG